MIDFRYHLVSLISVFLALAVGIALGAGPLKEAIGDSLTGQVAQLRTEKETLRTQLDTSQSTLAGEESFVDQSAVQLLTGRLTGRHVAVVLLGKVSDDVRSGVDARLTQAGATLTAHVTLTDTWTDTAQRSYRQALAARLAGYLSPAPAADATTEDELGQSLVQALVGADGSDATKPSEAAAVLQDLLTTGDNPLISVAGKISTPADSVVVIAPPLAPGDEQAQPSSDATTSHLALLAAAQSGSTGALLVDGPRGGGSLVDALLADKNLSGKVSSVSTIQTVSAQVSVPLALAAQIAGQVGHYGHGSAETVLPPSVTLPAVGATAPTGSGG